MKRESSTATPGTFKGNRTPTKVLLEKTKEVAVLLADKARIKVEDIHQMDSERLERIEHMLRRRASEGDPHAQQYFYEKDKDKKKVKK